MTIAPIAPSCMSDSDCFDSGIKVSTEYDVVKSRSLMVQEPVSSGSIRITNSLLFGHRTPSVPGRKERVYVIVRPAMQGITIVKYAN